MKLNKTGNNDYILSNKIIRKIIIKNTPTIKIIIRKKELKFVFLQISISCVLFNRERKSETAPNDLMRI